MPSIFRIAELAATLPDSAATMLTDLRLTDELAASCRIFRVHRPVPAHFHRISDEYLYVVSGSAEILIGSDEPRAVRPGDLIFFRKGTPHAIPHIFEHPFAVLAIDTPRRPPTDIHFVHPDDGTPDTFIQTLPRP